MGAHELQMHRPAIHTLTKEMKFCIYMLTSIMKHWIFAEGDRGSVIHLDDQRMI